MGGSYPAMRSGIKNTRVQNKHKIDAETFPVNSAQAGDGGGDFTAKHIDAHRIADGQAKIIGRLIGHRHQWRAGILAVPPFAFDKF